MTGPKLLYKAAADSIFTNQAEKFPDFARQDIPAANPISRTPPPRSTSERKPTSGLGSDVHAFERRLDRNIGEHRILGRVIELLVVG
jgi:hypothetical protein